MKRVMLLAAIAVLCSIFCGGCWLIQGPGVQVVETYDLASVSVQKMPACRFDRVRNLSPAGRKMLYRHADNRISESAVCWVQSPEALLGRYLESSFPVAPDAPLVGVTILCFELDLVAGRSVMTVELTCSGKGNGPEKIRRQTCTAPLTDASGAAASRAMSLCAEELSKTITNMIQEK